MNLCIAEGGQTAKRSVLCSWKHKECEPSQGTDTTTKKTLSSRQAQLRVRESSQKLQLLRHSLEKCLQENNQRPALQPAGPTEVSEDPPSPGGSSRGRPWMSSSASFLSLRPASLTGIIAHHHVFLSQFHAVSTEDSFSSLGFKTMQSWENKSQN